MAAFEELGTCPELIRAVSEMGWLLPTPVQAEAVGLILGGGDVAAAAETGSGKTGAFALPILQVCHEALQQRAVDRKNFVLYFFVFCFSPFLTVFLLKSSFLTIIKTQLEQSGRGRCFC